MNAPEPDAKPPEFTGRGQQPGETREQWKERVRLARVARLAPFKWKKGCPSPNAHPEKQLRFKLSKILRDVLSREMDEEEGRLAAVAVVEQIVQEALKGKEWAAKVLFDRIDGPMTQKVDLKQHGDGDITTRLSSLETRINRVLQSGEDGPDALG